MLPNLPQANPMRAPLRVLVVEPDESTRDALAVGLSDEYVVTTAHGPATAFALLAANTFDGVVIDAGDRGDDDARSADDDQVEDLVAAVRACAPDVAVVVTSTHADVAPSARRLGVPYVAKPFSLRTVSRSLAVALVRRS